MVIVVPVTSSSKEQVTDSMKKNLGWEYHSEFADHVEIPFTNNTIHVVFSRTLTPYTNSITVEKGEYSGFRCLEPGTIYLGMCEGVYNPSDDYRLDPEGFRKHFEVKSR